MYALRWRRGGNIPVVMEGALLKGGVGGVDN